MVKKVKKVTKKNRKDAEKTAAKPSENVSQVLDAVLGTSAGTGAVGAAAGINGSNASQLQQTSISFEKKEVGMKQRKTKKKEIKGKDKEEKKEKKAKANVAKKSKVKVTLEAKGLSDDDEEADAPRFTESAAGSLAETELSLKEDRDRTWKLLGEVLENENAAEEDDDDFNEEKLMAGGGRVGRKVDAVETRKVFVGGLPWKKTPEMVQEFFEEYGEIDSFNMPENKQSGKPMGVAFIIYASRESAEKALAMNGKTYGGQKLRVSIANAEARGKSWAPPKPQNGSLQASDPATLARKERQGWHQNKDKKEKQKGKKTMKNKTKKGKVE
eukprot:TRINITY_DN79320_c0_g1_i1.p1 TRINITY_DN79320_c0_g1~~TRINITY_DN79320_c0_g1_i1.p1  ORF type:complete len:343 (-),score=107.80 TRINITY_DN79320_c0_g1_i1:890-1873(-)